MATPFPDPDSAPFDCSRCLFRNECLAITMHQITPDAASDCLARQAGLLIVTRGCLHLEQYGQARKLTEGDMLSLPLADTRMLPTHDATDVVIFEMTGSGQFSDNKPQTNESNSRWFKR